MSIDPETFRHEPAYTVHGQLQRGRGAGYLAALELPRAEAHRMVIDCITRDPRIDPQVESRTEYFAALAQRLELPVQPLAEHLKAHNNAGQNCWVTSLTIEVLGLLGRRGVVAASEVLRDYVEWGQAWDEAIRELAQSSNANAWKGLDGVICSRFPTIDQLEAALGWFRSEDPGWAAWIKSNPVIADLHKRSQRHGLPSHEGAEEWTSLPTGELLLRANEQNWRQLAGIIRLRAAAEDVTTALASLAPDRPFAAAVALSILREHVDPKGFKALLEFWGLCPPSPRWLRRRCGGVIARLQSVEVHQLGRQWLNSTDKEERWLAEEILDNHGNSDDVLLLRTAIEGCLDDEPKHLYRLCSLIDAFMNMPNLGSVPELERAFVECRYSYARKRAAWAMRETAPGRFQKTFGRECLWDCESDTRELGCEVADTALAECRQRLLELGGDPFEEEEVRTAVKRRLDDRSHR